MAKPICLEPVTEKNPLLATIQASSSLASNSLTWLFTGISNVVLLFSSSR